MMGYLCFSPYSLRHSSPLLLLSFRFCTVFFSSVQFSFSSVLFCFFYFLFGSVLFCFLFCSVQFSSLLFSSVLASVLASLLFCSFFPVLFCSLFSSVLFSYLLFSFLLRLFFKFHLKRVLAYIVSSQTAYHSPLRFPFQPSVKKLAHAHSVIISFTVWIRSALMLLALKGSSK